MIYPIDEFLSIYSELKGKFQRREISRDAFVEQVRNLRAQDDSGTFWVVDPYNDQFLRYTGKKWVVDNSILKWLKVKPDPSRPQPRPDQSQSSEKISQARPPTQPAQAHPHGSSQSPKTTAAHKPRQSGQASKIQDLSPQPPPKKPVGGLRVASILLALIPSLVCGGLWFLYTFIGVFKNEGLSGIDFCTPAIIIVVPASFWLFGKQIDRLLTPLQPIIGVIPKPLRYGIVLGVPILFGCGCSILSQRGYFLLQLSTIISVIVAGIFMRVPEVKK